MPLLQIRTNHRPNLPFSVQSRILILFLFPCSLSFAFAQTNPFLKPGSNKPKPPVVQRPAPPPPKPIPRNPNLEFTGYYKFQGEWKLALFDKVKNQGFWLSKGESLEGVDAEVESFNPETEEIKLQGGMVLKLKDSEKSVLPVPSGQASSNKPPIPVSPANAVPKPGIPLPRRR